MKKIILIAAAALIIIPSLILMNMDHYNTDISNNIEHFEVINPTSSTK
ncbi:hypothetical protein [Vibrio caribbeanicus]|uniref:Uncharacterized protein n=1 Tax=Vibrio caribbeanicus ATCC BAA-2122 TaxID=796620 RepID=E3BKH7_9VIBR|nr:hypothetical protein [Vibrio caribbeanicus]EFP96562.1 hypothetical protein VIBC2010_05289 [Vibrio caribbeanicus ATCC BAA-2122]